MYNRRNYGLLLIGQFLGAFGDNALLAVIVGQLTYLQRSGAINNVQLRSASTLYTSLLFVPYVLLAPFAGYLNDRYSKSGWLAGGNSLKVLGTLICMIPFGNGSLVQGIGYVVVGIGACFYGPAKYGILPEILPRDRLVRANGAVELLTLLAILSGAIGGAVLSDKFQGNSAIGFIIVGAIFAAALGCSLAMNKTPAHPEVQLGMSVSTFLTHCRDLLRSPRLSRMLIGTALFWVCGAALKINFQPWGLQTLGLTNNTAIALLGLWLSIGVMIGSVLAGRLHRVGDLHSTRYYGLALAAMLAVMFAVSPNVHWLNPVVRFGPIVVPIPVALVLIGAGIMAGLFLIPLNAALQAESDSDKLGKTIAVQNLFDNLGMCTAGGFVFAAAHLGLSASGVFLGLAIAIATAMIFFKFAPVKISTAPKSAHVPAH